MDEPTAPTPTDSPPLGGSASRIRPAPDHAEEALADLVDDAVPRRSYEMLPMVGLGGSAGGIAALQRFFAAAPADSGMVFVVVMHLAADHESALPQILQRATAMPVQQVDETVRTQADHVYVIPPGKTLSSAKLLFEFCATLSPERGRRVAVDLLVGTLADTHGPNAAKIVLSGADGDGADRHQAHQGARRSDDRSGPGRRRAPGPAALRDRHRHGRLAPAGTRRYAVAPGLVHARARPAEAAARRLQLARTEAVGADELEASAAPTTCARAPGATSATTSGRRSCAGSPGA